MCVQDWFRCKYRKANVGATCRGYNIIYRSFRSEYEMKVAVAEIGPLAVGISGYSDTFRLYSGGIYDDPKCSRKLDHAVLIVGYGTDDGKDYWLVRNR